MFTATRFASVPCSLIQVRASFSDFGTEGVAGFTGVVVLLFAAGAALLLVLVELLPLLPPLLAMPMRTSAMTTQMPIFAPFGSRFQR
jgi:hypothetical protein